MNVYWIDSYIEYDAELVKNVMDLFQNFYYPLLKEVNLNFQVVDINEIKFHKNEILHKNSNLFFEDAIAYINCTNPSIEKETVQKKLYEIAIQSKKLSVLNYVKDFPLIDKNKLSAIKIANELGLKTIPTVSIENPRNVNFSTNQISSKIGLPAVIKPVDMFGGIAVHIVYDEAQLTSLLEILTFTNRKFIAQKKYDIVSDCRVYIADSNYISCLKRIPKSKDSLGNVAKGATTIEFTPPQYVIDASIKLTEKISAPFLCVDWFEVENGDFIFSEIETAGGFVQLPIASRKKVAEKLFRWKSND